MGGPSNPATSPIVQAAELFWEWVLVFSTGDGFSWACGAFCLALPVSWKCVVPDHLVLVSFAAVPSVVLCCSVMGLGSWLSMEWLNFWSVMYYMGVITFSVYLCPLWSTACIGVVGLQCPSLGNQYTKWQTNTRITHSIYSRFVFLIS